MNSLTGSRELRAGDWRLQLEPDGAVSHVTFREEELLRGVQFVMRAARSWDTVPADAEVKIAETAEGFSVDIRALHRIDGTVFTRVGRIEGSPHSIRWHFRGQADSAFETNRTGFVVLHPLQVAGSPVTVTHSGGKTTRSAFPVDVSPDNPFLDVAELTYRMTSGTAVRLTFAGDEFETEDQRNWSDASFKTYSRPLALPYPYTIGAGEFIEQEVLIVARPAASPAQHADETADGAMVPWDERRSRPAIGIALGPDDDPERAVRLAIELRLDHVRVDVVADPGGARGLERLESVAKGGRIPVELAIHVSDRPDRALRELADALEACRARLAAIAVYDTTAPATTERSLTAACSGLGRLIEGVPLIVGTDDNFAELNRNRPNAVWGAETMTFGLTPQVHDQRAEAVLETAEALGAMIRTAFGFGSAVAVGAVSLRPRRNVYHGAAVDRLSRDPSAADPRQRDQFAAAWLVATIAELATAGVSRITAVEFEGDRGIADTAAGSRFPLTRVFAALGGADILHPAVSGPGYTVLPLTSASQRFLLAANLKPFPRTVTIDGQRIKLGPYQVELVPYEVMP
jgi:D-apionolactonase